MELKNRVTADIITAMKEKNKTKLDILRLVKSEIQRAEQTPKGKIELSDSEVIKIIKKLVEAIKETTNDMEELKAIGIYLPPQLSQHEIQVIVKKQKEEGLSKLGDFMKYFKDNWGGQYDGSILSIIVKNTLQCD